MDETKKIIGFVVNWFIPGLGTLIGSGDSKKTSGIIQLILCMIGLVLVISVIGFMLGVPMMMVAWIWALVDSIKMVQ